MDDFTSLRLGMEFLEVKKKEMEVGGGGWANPQPIYCLALLERCYCNTFLQWLLIAIDVSIMVVSLAGFAGTCYYNTFPMRLYLVVMFLIIVVLIRFIIFTYVVTDKGSRQRVMDWAYLEYYLKDYLG
ncbi:Tetraspanin-3 protein [Spatholobus suberectus]|nr:Tetraspanin-3 protein [Spatholobus suberectus]